MTEPVGDVEIGLRALQERYGLGADARDRIDVVLEGLTSDPRAPTTVRDPHAALNVHIADSLVALELEQVRAARRAVDIGAGAGLPGLVLSAALESTAFWLVESQASKCAFIAALSARAGIANARVECARAEEWMPGIEQQDLVVCRALAAQPVVLEYAAPLLQLGGHLVEWRGVRSSEDERQAAAAAAMLGLHRLEIRHVEPFAGARDRHLHVFEKVSATPEGFPRRPGLARKRPLGF